MDPTADIERSLREFVAQLRWGGLAADGIVGIGDTIEVIAKYVKELRIDLAVVGQYPQETAGRW